jgi:hypothetical protein
MDHPFPYGLNVSNEVIQKVNKKRLVKINFEIAVHWLPILLYRILHNSQDII